jgi:hypothetical protein
MIHQHAVRSEVLASRRDHRLSPRWLHYETGEQDPLLRIDGIRSENKPLCYQVEGSMDQYRSANIMSKFTSRKLLFCGGRMFIQ